MVKVLNAFEVLLCNICEQARHIISFIICTISSLCLLFSVLIDLYLTFLSQKTPKGHFVRVEAQVHVYKLVKKSLIPANFSHRLSCLFYHDLLLNKDFCLQFSAM